MDDEVIARARARSQRKKVKLEELERFKSEISHAISSLEVSENQESRPNTEKEEQEFARIRDETLSKIERAFAKTQAEVNELMNEKIAHFNSTMTNSLQNLQNTVAFRSSKLTPKTEPTPKTVWGEKVHVKRAPILSKLFKQEDIRTIYNIFVAVMMLMACNLMMTKYKTKGHLIDFSLLEYSFGDAGGFFAVWIPMFIGHLLIIPYVQLIKTYRPPAVVHLSVYFMFLGAFVFLPTYLLLVKSFPPATGMIISAENVRMGMKIHAYYREKMLYGFGNNKFNLFIPEHAQKAGVTLKNIKRPIINIRDASTELGRYLYFSFAPTLIYRDDYPTLQRKTKWARVFIDFANFLLVVVFSFMIWEIYCMPHFKSTYLDPASTETFFHSVFLSILPANICLFLAFFGVIHSWENAWAEMLCFGDRRFYSDWWSSKNFAFFYRNWNVVLQEWFYYYVYQDCMRFSLGFITKDWAVKFALVISSIIHELVIIGPQGFFYPAMTLLFCLPGMAFFRSFKLGPSSQIANVIFWFFVSLLTGILMVLHARAFYTNHSGDATQTTDLMQFWSFILRSIQNTFKE